MRKDAEPEIIKGKKPKKHKVQFLLVMILLAVLSSFFLEYVWLSSIADNEQHALSLANAAGKSLNLELTADLSGTAADVENPSYKQLKQNLIDLAKTDEHIAFVYLYNQKDGKIHIMADSEPVTSPDYSPPGQEYTEANRVFFNPFTDNKSQVTPQVTDRWGTWISVLVPMKDIQTGKTTTVLGIDYSVDVWYAPVKTAMLQASGIVAAVFLLSVSLYVLMIRNASLRQKHKELLLANEESQAIHQQALESSNEIKQQSDIREILLDISAEFARVDFDSVFPVINRALEKVGKAVGADRAYTLKYYFDEQTCRKTFEWCADGIEPTLEKSQNMPISSLYGWPEQHRQGETVFIPDVSALPQGDAAKESLERQGIKSLLAVPMMLGSECFGFAGLDFMKQATEYSEQARQLLAQCSNMLINTFEKLKLAKELSDNEEKYRNIFEYSPVGVFNFDVNGFIVDCNDYFVDIIGSTREKLVGLDLFKLRDLKIIDCIRGALKGQITEYNDVYHSVTSHKVTPIRAKFSPILSQENKITGGTGIIEDITERKKLGDELRLKSLVLDQLEEHITITDLKGEITYANQAQVDALKVSRQELIGQKSIFCGKDDSRSEDTAGILDKTLKGGLWRGDVTNITAEGNEVILNCRTQVICSENGEPLALAAIASDITARRKMEVALFKEKEQFKTTLLSVGDGVISTDSKGKVMVLNKIAEQLIGFTQPEAFGKPLELVFNIINEYTGARCENPVKEVLATGKNIELSNHTILISRDGVQRFIEDSAAPIKDEQGNITGVVLVFRDCTEKKQKQQEIEYLSYHDQLTGLFNRRYYETEILKLDDEKHFPLTMIMTDVNGLKLTNDAFGHDAGDLLLIKIANILKRECRARDIVARIGGDEFILLLPETDEKNTQIIINRINAAIAKEKLDNVVLSISVGYAVKDSRTVDINEVFMKAEDAMYRHKLSESLSMRSKTIDLILSSLFEKNKREAAHSKRVSGICEDLAKAMDYSTEEIKTMKIAGLMHDIGKIGISEAVLNKPGKLNHDEWNEIERHSEIGYRILGSVNEFSKIADYILEHHERLDGKGYPRGIAGSDISPQARIITIADAYDAMTWDRPYGKALSKQKAVSELKKHAGSQFDPEIAKVFAEKVLGIPWE